MSHEVDPSRVPLGKHRIPLVIDVDEELASIIEDGSFEGWCAAAVADHLPEIIRTAVAERLFEVRVSGRAARQEGEKA